jgi:hypothetical protein
VAVLQSYGVDTRLINVFKDTNENAEAAVRTYGTTGQWFKTKHGTRQGDPISPSVFITVLVMIMDKIKNNRNGVSVRTTETGYQ